MFKDLFKKKEQEIEHCVILHFNYGLDSVEPLQQLQLELDSILQSTGTGDCDGHEIATDLSDGFIYCYGNNADAVFEAIKSKLESTSFMRGCKVKLRYGPPEDGVEERSFVL